MISLRPASFAILLACIAFTSCTDTAKPDSHLAASSKATVMSIAVSITLGEMGPSLQKRYPDLVRVEHQPAGLDFYKINWLPKSDGKVHLSHGPHSFDINHALNVLSSQDLEEFRSEGLFRFTVQAGLSASERMAHDEARLKMYALLRQIGLAGWRPLTPRSRPRLSGQARIDYALNVSQSIGLDPQTVPTLSEWMRIENGTVWSFFASGVYLEITFTRERGLEAAKPAAYLLSLDILTEREYLRSYTGPDSRLNWRQSLAAELEKAANARAQKEAMLRAKGVAIDETYQDPPIPALN